MEAITIKKAKLNTKGGADVTYIDSGGNEIQLRGVKEIHPELLQAFRNLAPFLIDLTEQREAKSIDWETIRDTGSAQLPVAVTGISRVMGEGGEKAQMLGARTLASGAAIKLDSPVMDMETLVYDWERYKDFEKRWQQIQRELVQYVEDSQ